MDSIRQHSSDQLNILFKTCQKLRNWVSDFFFYTLYPHTQISNNFNCRGGVYYLRRSSLIRLTIVRLTLKNFELFRYVLSRQLHVIAGWVVFHLRKVENFTQCCFQSQLSFKVTEICIETGSFLTSYCKNKLHPVSVLIYVSLNLANLVL